MVERLRKTKMLSAVDDAVIYQYAKLWEETEGIAHDHEATRRLVGRLQRTAMKQLEGEMLVDAIGQIERMRARLSGMATQLRMQRLAIRVYLIEFGMSPASRSRVTLPLADAEKSPVQNKLIAFLGGKAARA